jgi:LPS O-antigen subunit length determinant protein (WzzB/FepE family)
MHLTNAAAFVKVLGPVSLAGALAGLAISYRVPPRYTSSAVLRMSSVVEAGKPVATDVLRREADDRVEQLKVELTGRDTILSLLKEPGLDLYPDQREREPLEDVAERIQADDLHVVPLVLTDGGAGFRVSFAYPDRAKAQAVVRELAAQAVRDGVAVDETKSRQWADVFSTPIPFRQRLDLAQPASLPGGLSRPQRSLFASAGLAAGLFAGALYFLARRRPKFILRIAACGAVGFALAGGLSLAISEQYTARAVMRLPRP